MRNAYKNFGAIVAGFRTWANILEFRVLNHNNNKR